MRTLLSLLFEATVTGSLLLGAVPLPAQTEQPPTNLDRRFARHFPDRPPLQFEVEPENGQRGPRIIITNLSQFRLTAYVVQTEPKAPQDVPQTMICDALTRVALLTPIPRGLSHSICVPRIVGSDAPDAKLVAAVWEDGSTFGPDDLLARISESRKVMADSYDLAISALQTGMDKNWSVQEYLMAAQKLTPAVPPPAATLEEARAMGPKFTAAMLPSHTITNNLQHATQRNDSPQKVALLVHTLIQNFEQSRDALRQSLGNATASPELSRNK